MSKKEKDIQADEYTADALFAASDEEILEIVSSLDIVQEAEARRERVFRQIAERMNLPTVCDNCDTILPTCEPSPCPFSSVSAENWVPCP